MRYEFEVGDYVKLIANRTASSKEVGFIGQVKRTKHFAGFGICCALDDNENSWSCLSDLAPATKAEYEAYYKPKSKFKIGDKVILKANTRRSTKDVGYIGEITEIYNENELCYRVGDGIANWSNECDLELYIEPQFKVGDWVKVKPDAKASAAGTNMHNMIIKIGKICDGMNGKYIDDYEQSNLSVDNNKYGIYLTELVLATKAEVKQHLLVEAERRGFKTGVTYLNHSDDKYTADMNPAFWHQYSLYCGFAQGLIYDDEHNKWGTIVAKDKELCGHKVEQPASSSFIKIGCKAISRGEIQGFLNVCDKFNITGVYSEFVKGQSIGLDAIKEALK